MGFAVDDLPSTFVPDARSMNDPAFVWVCSAATDVTQTWRKFGWKPISERTDHEANRIRARQSSTGFWASTQDQRESALPQQIC